MLWPLIVLWCTPERLIRVCVATIAGGILVRLTLASKGAPAEALYMFTPCRADALACGAAAAALMRIPACKAWLQRSTHIIGAGAAAMLVVATLTTHGYAIYDRESQALGYTFVALAFALLVLLAAVPVRGFINTALRPLSTSPMRRIGRYSYAMYVFHLPLHVFVGLPLLERLFPTISVAVALLHAVAISVVSIAAAALSYELFERHFLHLKDRIAYKSATSTAARIGES